MSKNFVSYGDAETLMAGVDDRIKKNYFEGTEDEWNDLTDEQKAVYDNRPVFIKGDDVPIDLSPYQRKALDTPLTIGGNQQNYVEGALGALNDAKGDKTVLDNEVVTRATLGAHNLLDNKALTTTFTDSDKTITFTVNSDKSVTVNGETGSSTNRGLVLNSSVPTKLGVKYILSGCPSGGSDNTYDISAYSSDFAINVRDFGEGVEFTGNGDTITVRVWAKNSTAINNKVFYPMLRLATDADTTYRPYVPTNEELLSYKDNGVLGAKNLWPHGNQSVYQQKGFYVNIPNGRYIFSADVTSDDTDANTCLVYDLTNGNPLGYIGRGTNQSIVIDINNVSIISLYASTYAILSTGDTATFNNVMIRRVNDTDPTYQPYAMTNQQLTGDMIYSTSEVDTGKIWIDGKKIYRKVINCGTAPSASPTSKSVPHNISNLSSIVSISGICVNGTTAFLPFPYPATNLTTKDGLGVYVMGRNIVMVSEGYDFSAYTAYAVLEYTKTT